MGGKKIPTLSFPLLEGCHGRKDRFPTCVKGKDAEFLTLLKQGHHEMNTLEAKEAKRRGDLLVLVEGGDMWRRHDDKTLPSAPTCPWKYGILKLQRLGETSLYR